MQANSTTRLGTIHFNGRLSLRSSDKKLKGQAFSALPGNLVFSKIDARNGAIAVIPDEIGEVGFSAEYPIFSVADPEKVSEAFLSLLCRTPTFLSQLQGLAVGHSGRKRVGREDFEQLLVPLPSRDDQDDLVNQFREAQAGLRRQEREAAEAFAAAQRLILAELGMPAPSASVTSGVLAVDSQDMRHWSVRRAFSLAEGGDDRATSSYPMVTLGDERVVTIGRGVSKNPGNRPSADARSYIRVANVRAGWLDVSDIKRLDISSEKFAEVRLQRDDILVCRNNSLELVGKAAMWRDEISECAHDDHTYRLRANPAILVPGYLEAYINCPFAARWLQDRSQITTNLAGLPGSALKSLPVPIPPIELQSALADQYREAVNGIRQAEDAARAQLRTIWADFEERIDRHAGHAMDGSESLPADTYQL